MTYVPSTVKRTRRTAAALDVLDDAIETAVEQDSPVTLRGVFYRVVSAGGVDKSEAGYRAIGRQLIKLRRSGRVPYSSITDGTRLIQKPESWTAADEMLADAAASYRRSLWHSQDAEVIVMSEKDAISGVVYPVTAAWDVELGITRGYSSETFTHSVAETIIDNYWQRSKTTYVYQLGDHDPSGVDAWRDFRAKVVEFVSPHALDVDEAVRFERLAVTPEQIVELALPTRPTKRTDTRSSGFEGESVEVDAIPARILRQIVETAISKHVDPAKLAITQQIEDEERDLLTRMASGWPG
jgi:hypothetical protein